MSEKSFQPLEIPGLLELGLTEYEARAYLAMLDQDLVSAADITRMCGVPRGRVYDVVNKLIQKGFCVTGPGVVKKFRAIDPESAIFALVEQQKHKERRMLETAKKLQVRYNNKKENVTTLDYLQVLTTKQSQINRHREFHRSVTKSLLSFNKRPYASKIEIEDIKKASATLSEKIRSGVQARAIYEAEHASFFLEWLEYFDSIGEDIRISRELPLKMLIADKSIAMLSLRNDTAEAFKLSSLVVEHTDLTRALVQLFEYHWEKSMTLEEFRASRIE
ncbi:MAG: helix-turn-helix domain-containing protein [Acidobacteriota bacterium]